MTPTAPGALLRLVVGSAVVGYLLALLLHGPLPPLPRYAPISLVLLAVAELGMAKVVRDRVLHRRDAAGRPPGRPLHPMQVARAAVLAKASSAGGAILLGFYAGVLAWALPRRSRLTAAADDALTAALSVAACLLLVIAALVLERACRRPDDPGLESQA